MSATHNLAVLKRRIDELDQAIAQFEEKRSQMQKRRHAASPAMQARIDEKLRLNAACLDALHRSRKAAVIAYEDGCGG